MMGVLTIRDKEEKQITWGHQKTAEMIPQKIPAI